MKTLKDKIENGREYRDVRSFAEVKPEIREDGQEAEPTYVVEGYASTFNEPYTLWTDGEYTFREQIDPSAFNETDMSDVIFQYDHEGRVFARKSNETLEVDPDEHGLHIRAYLGGTEAGKQLFEEIRGGYTTKMSFGFTVGADERHTSEDSETGEVEVLRTITRVSKLYDVSAVSLPANDGTAISARSFSEGVLDEVREEIAAKHEREERIRRINEKLED